MWVVFVALLLQHPDHALSKEVACALGKGKEYVLRSNNVVLVKWK